jgi:diamine N-acetyltransferase
MEVKMELHLEKITYLNWHDVEDLCVNEEQRDFVADNVSSLALAGVIREAGFHVFSFGVYLGEEPIGFAMIGYDIPLDTDDDVNEKYWFTRSSYFIWRFMIDKRWQGKGYGKEALRLLIDFIRSAPCREAKYAWLCYNTDNTVARNMYASAGFEEVPEAYDEEDDEMPAVLKL